MQRKAGKDGLIATRTAWTTSHEQPAAALACTNLPYPLCLPANCRHSPDVLTGSKMRCCCCGGSVEYSGSTLTGPTLLPICCTSLVILRQASSISSSPVRNTNTSPAATAGSKTQHSDQEPAGGEHQSASFADNSVHTTSSATCGASSLLMLLVSKCLRLHDK